MLKKRRFWAKNPMRMRGLEPPRGCPHRHLRPARLPIPPHPRRIGHPIKKTLFCQEFLFVKIWVAATESSRWMAHRVACFTTGGSVCLRTGDGDFLSFVISFSLFNISLIRRWTLNVGRSTLLLSPLSHHRAAGRFAEANPQLTT
jgi:hypothetical protein